MYTEELAVIAKRENNTKRSYLVVNPYQGKHIPVDPEKALEMFGVLGEQVRNRCQGERLLLIGFAETATAIGEALAIQLDTYYMQTTREQIPSVEYLYFSESHSHATEQKLVKDDLDRILPKIDRIVFVEDEVTTGNTIGKIVRLIRETYEKEVLFSAASLLNGMNQEAQNIYQEQKIDTLYLVKTDHSRYGEIAERYAGNGRYHMKNTEPVTEPFTEFEEIFLGHKGMDAAGSGAAFHPVNARRLHKGTDYRQACEGMWQEVSRRIPLERGQKILVLGTEEFMYPALYLARKIQGLGHQVRCHATTRSPIAVSQEAQYPLKERYELASMYDPARRTYIYDLEASDLVLVLTDADPAEPEGWNSLQHAINASGSKQIKLIRWC